MNTQRITIWKVNNNFDHLSLHSWFTIFANHIYLIHNICHANQSLIWGSNSPKGSPFSFTLSSWVHEKVKWWEDKNCFERQWSFWQACSSQIFVKVNQNNYKYWDGNAVNDQLTIPCKRCDSQLWCIEFGWFWILEILKVYYPV